MCYVTVSFEHSFAASSGPSYDNDALPWQLQALQSLSHFGFDRPQDMHSFADDYGGILLPGTLSSSEAFCVSAIPARSKNLVFYDQPRSQITPGVPGDAQYSTQFPLFVEFLRCRDLPKMDTFGTCDCFITCGNWSTECVKNTQYAPFFSRHLLPSLLF